MCTATTTGQSPEVEKEKWMNAKLNKSKSQVLQYPHARDKMMSPEGQKTDSSIDSN
jgi:hypothetical protein